MGYNGDGYGVGNEDEVGMRARGNEDEGERGRGGMRTRGNEDEGEQERGGTYRVGTGLELSGVNWSCVRTGSDTFVIHALCANSTFIKTELQLLLTLRLPISFPFCPLFLVSSSI